MSKTVSSILLAAVLLVVQAGLVFAQVDRRVAVTFDDLPVVAASSDDVETHRKITLRLLHALAEREISAIGFVNEGKFTKNGIVDDNSVDLLRLSLAAGFDLGNHSFSHPDLHKTSLSDFQEDVLQGELITRALLAERGRTPRYFRHPYLHTGLDLDTKQGLESFLDKRNYRVAPVTIDNSDWIYARAYALVMRSGDKVSAEKVGKEYVDYMLTVIDFYESQSEILFNRNMAHILLVHANELNSDWFGVLADSIADRDYEFISLDEALQDAAYTSPDTYTGPGGITWLHRWAITRGVDRKMFRGEPEPPAHILKLAQIR